MNHEGVRYLGFQKAICGKIAKSQKGIKMKGGASKNHGLKEEAAEIAPAREKLLSAELMPKFKEPFGLLIPGPPEVTISILRKLLSEEKASKIIAVGDVVTRSLREAGIKGNLYVTDDKVMRERIKPLDFEGLESMKVLRVFNPPGRLMAEAFQAIDNALRSPDPVRIEVDGEEDLLVLPAVILAPIDSLVLYGQPRKGLVVVRVTEEKKREALELYRAMPEPQGA
ncbi:MAG: GTP-dependent dephospho-CoA kinase family protein [Candidatus Bathyarchaeia archaeon]